MAYFNNDRSRQGEKTRDVKEYTKRGAVKGRPEWTEGKYKKNHVQINRKDKHYDNEDL